MYISAWKDKTFSEVSCIPGNCFYCGFQLFQHDLECAFLVFTSATHSRQSLFVLYFEWKTLLLTAL